MKRYLSLRIVLAVTSIISMAGCKEIDDNKARPNVLMISIDDLNTNLSCMGDPNAITPYIDSLAFEGVLFNNAHCQAPLCGPSRSSIMTGLRPSTTGIYGHIEDEDLRNANPRTKESVYLPQYFSKHGYHTMGIGKLFHMHAPKEAFDESGGRAPGFGPIPADSSKYVWKNKGTSTDWAVFPDVDEKMPDYQSAQWTIDRLNRDYKKPFFLSVGFLRPHVPLYVPQKWFDKYNNEEIITPPYLPEDFDDIPDIALRVHEVSMMPTTKWAIENGEWKNIIEAYLASVSFVDYYVGQIIKALNESKYKDNTIVVLWSDHGYRLGEKGAFAKHSLWQEATRVPIIFAGKGIPSNVKIDQTVELLDLYPTLLELCDLPENEQNEGVSLKPIFDNPKIDLNKAAITTYGWNNHAVAKDNFRYIRYENGAEELYDHSIDPNEFNNVATDSIYFEDKENLIKLLPETNEPWSELSKHNVNEYMVKQRLDHISKKK